MITTSLMLIVLLLLIILVINGKKLKKKTRRKRKWMEYPANMMSSIKKENVTKCLWKCVIYKRKMKRLNSNGN